MYWPQTWTRVINCREPNPGKLGNKLARRSVTWVLIPVPAKQSQQISVRLRSSLSWFKLSLHPIHVYIEHDLILWLEQCFICTLCGRCTQSSNKDLKKCSCAIPNCTVISIFLKLFLNQTITNHWDRSYKNHRCISNPPRKRRDIYGPWNTLRIFWWNRKLWVCLNSRNTRRPPAFFARIKADSVTCRVQVSRLVTQIAVNVLIEEDGAGLRRCCCQQGHQAENLKSLHREMPRSSAT